MARRAVGVRLCEIANGVEHFVKICVVDHFRIAGRRIGGLTRLRERGEIIIHRGPQRFHEARNFVIAGAALKGFSQRVLGGDETLARQFQRFILKLER